MEAKIKALTSFSGKISMRRSEERLINDEELLEDLEAAGYIEVLQVDDTKERPPKKRGGKKEE